MYAFDGSTHSVTKEGNVEPCMTLWWVNVVVPNYIVNVVLDIISGFSITDFATKSPPPLHQSYHPRYI